MRGRSWRHLSRNTLLHGLRCGQRSTPSRSMAPTDVQTSIRCSDVCAMPRSWRSSKEAARSHSSSYQSTHFKSTNSLNRRTQPGSRPKATEDKCMSTSLGEIRAVESARVQEEKRMIKCVVWDLDETL